MLEINLLNETIAFRNLREVLSMPAFTGKMSHVCTAKGC